MEKNRGNLLAINHADVLTMAGGGILKNRLIVIKGGRISAIEEASENTGSFPDVVDGRGKTVMPGLINMHTHLGDNPQDLLLYLASGVTAIRNMWGYEGFDFRQWLFGTRVFHHLRLKKDIEEGRIIGPSIFTAGPLLDGDPPFFPKFMCLRALEDRDGIERVIKEQAAKGYDFIKVYSRLSKRSFEDIMQISGVYGMPVAGHVPDAAGLRRALELKMHSVEHLYGFVNPYRPELNLDQEEIKELAGLSAANGVWHCPTLIANERIMDTGKRDAYEKEEQMDYVSPRSKSAMRFLLKASAKLIPGSDPAGIQAFMETLRSIVRRLQSEGAGILMGTDKAAPYVVAGFSEHLEMKLLSEAGISNYDVLGAATVSAAKCLGQEAEMGTVAAGKRANLILADGNPLEDLDAVRRHAGVVKDGVYYSRQKCDEMLQKARQTKNCSAGNR
jgi:imidazolonepropionase-like amidohydrolase